MLDIAALTSVARAQFLISPSRPSISAAVRGPRTRQSAAIVRHPHTPALETETPSPDWPRGRLGLGSGCRTRFPPANGSGYRRTSFLHPDLFSPCSCRSERRECSRGARAASTSGWWVVPSERGLKAARGYALRIARQVHGKPCGSRLSSLSRTRDENRSRPLKGWMV